MVEAVGSVSVRDRIERGNLQVAYAVVSICILRALCVSARENNLSPLVVCEGVFVARRRAGEGVVCVRQRIDDHVVERRRNSVYEIAAVGVVADAAADRVGAWRCSQCDPHSYTSSYSDI